MTDLVIFDCDGVLIDSEHIGCRIEAECLAEAGFPITVEAIAVRFVGLSMTAMFDAIAAEHGRPVPPDLPGRLRDRMRAAFEAELRAIPGIEALLRSLRMPACVASSSDPERLRHTLGITGLWDFFAPNVFSATMVRRGKPAPDLFLHAARTMGVEPARCVVIEDSKAGVQAAVAAGMRVLGFAGGGHCGPDHADRLRAAGASQVFGRMVDLQAYLAAPAGASRT